MKVYWVYNGELYDDEPEADEEGLFSRVVGAEHAERYRAALEEIHLIARGQVTQYATARKHVERLAADALASPRDLAKED